VYCSNLDGHRQGKPLSDRRMKVEARTPAERVSSHRTPSTRSAVRRPALLRANRSRRVALAHGVLSAAP
jgi:hypothetical protein